MYKVLSVIYINTSYLPAFYNRICILDKFWHSMDGLPIFLNFPKLLFLFFDVIKLFCKSKFLFQLFTLPEYEIIFVIYLFTGGCKFTTIFQVCIENFLIWLILIILMFYSSEIMKHLSWMKNAFYFFLSNKNLRSIS